MLRRSLSSKQSQWRYGGPGRPPVALAAIRGEIQMTFDLAWPAVMWNEGKCWAYLHDLDTETLAMVMSSLRVAELERSAPHSFQRI